MTFGNKFERIATFHELNWALFVVGMAIVALSSQAVIPLLGAFIASIHVAVKVGD